MMELVLLMVVQHNGVCWTVNDNVKVYAALTITLYLLNNDRDICRL